MMRIVFVIAAVVGIFMFPWPFALMLGLVAAALLPVAGIAFGVLYDILYYPGGYWPVASILGLVVTGLALFVRSFVKERIMGA